MGARHQNRQRGRPVASHRMSKGLLHGSQGTTGRRGGPRLEAGLKWARRGMGRRQQGQSGSGDGEAVWTGSTGADAMTSTQSAEEARQEAAQGVDDAETHACTIGGDGKIYILDKDHTHTGNVKNCRPTQFQMVRRPGGAHSGGRMTGSRWRPKRR
jgi:hypothetical protein